MKTILLFRHGKADHAGEDGADKDRPLTKRGKKTAAQMGRFLAALGQTPDAAYASPAVRAAETLRLAAKAGAWKCPADTSESLYATSPEKVLEFVRTLDGTGDCVLLAGHEPALSDLVAALMGGGHVKLATAAMARIDLPAETWAEVQPGTGTLVWLTMPKLLDGMREH
jgi:phosphohistidine phosphatase